MSVVSVVCCQVEDCASGRSPVQSSSTECGVSECDQGNSQRGVGPLELSSHKKYDIP